MFWLPFVRVSSSPCLCPKSLFPLPSDLPLEPLELLFELSSDAEELFPDEVLDEPELATELPLDPLVDEPELPVDALEDPDEVLDEPELATELPLDPLVDEPELATELPLDPLVDEPEVPVDALEVPFVDVPLWELFTEVLLTLVAVALVPDLVTELASLVPELLDEFPEEVLTPANCSGILPTPPPPLLHACNPIPIVNRDTKMIANGNDFIFFVVISFLNIIFSFI